MRFLAPFLVPLLLAGTAPDDPPTVAIRDATIVVSPEQTIEKGTVVLRDGLIEAVGEKPEIPYDAEVIDGAGLVVYAGFIDAHTRLGLPDEPRTEEERRAAESGEPDYRKGPLPATRPANRKGTYPELRASDVLKIPDGDVKRYHLAGFTTLLCAPPGQVLGGTSALVNLSKEPRRTAIFRPAVAMHAGFDAPGKGYPRTIMAAMAHLRQIFHDAKRHAALHADYRQDPEGKPRPPHDPALDAILPVLDSRLPLVFEVDSLNDIRRALGLGREFGLKTWISGGAEAYEAAEELKKKGIPVLLTLKWPDDPDEAAKKERREPEPEKLVRERRRLWEERVQCAIALHKAGVEFAFTSRGLDSPKEAIRNIRKLVEKGLPPEAALRAMTVAPAKLFGVAKTAGTVEKGRAANLTVMTGKFTDKKSKVRYIFADGRKFEYEPGEGDEPPAIDVTGTWKVTVRTADGPVEATLELVQTGSQVTGTMKQKEMGEAKITEGRVSGRKFSFSVTVDMGGESATFEFKGEMEGKEITGTVDGPFGEAEWKASKPDERKRR